MTTPSPRAREAEKLVEQAVARYAQGVRYEDGIHEEVAAIIQSAIYDARAEFITELNKTVVSKRPAEPGA